MIKKFNRSITELIKTRHSVRTYEEAENYSQILENVMLAPSALNKQPWRIIKENNAFHIYNEGKIEMSKIDIGIALCHFDLSVKEEGLKGEFKVLDESKSNKFDYIISWIANN